MMRRDGLVRFAAEKSCLVSCPFVMAGARLQLPAGRQSVAERVATVPFFIQAIGAFLLICIGAPSVSLILMSQSYKPLRTRFLKLLERRAYATPTRRRLGQLGPDDTRELDIESSWYHPIV